MKTVAIISQKGGAGKTTLSVHLATAAALSGHSAAIIDLDPQGTAASWGDRRRADAPEVVSGQAARLGVLIEAAQGNGANLLILDTAPNADQTALRAAQLADLVLIPCRAATFDLEAIQATLTLAELAKKPSYVVLNAIPPRSGIGREAAEGLAAQGARVAPAMLSQRAAFAHGVIDGRTAQEFEPDGKAAEEVGALAEGLTAQGARVAPAMLSQRAAFAHGVIDGRTAQEFEPDGKAAEEVGALYTWLCGTVGMSTGGQARKAA